MATARPTIIDFVEKYSRQYENNVYLREKVNGQWKEITQGQTREEAYRIGAGLMSLGVKKGDKIALLSESRAMWILSELGAMYAGATDVPLSVNLGEGKDLVFRINHSESKWILVSGNHLPKIRAIIGECPAVKRVIVFDDTAFYVDGLQAGEIRMSDIQKMGEGFLQTHRKDFVERYTPMVGHADAVSADPVFALLRRTEPTKDSFESFYQQPTFLGYTAVRIEGNSLDALTQSLMANLYSKRMPDFLVRCEAMLGFTLPRTIAEGLVTQAPKNPSVLQAFPQLQMNMQIYQGFLRNIQPYLKDRESAGRELFEQYHGYYPFYYFFGNLKATRKRDDKEHANSNVGVN